MYTGWITRGALQALLYWYLLPVSTATVVGSSRIVLATSHPEVIKIAKFAVQELRDLSDTGVYQTLSLKKISHAATREGVFHDNTFLTLELASPYFESGRHEESFEVVVMQHKRDGHLRDDFHEKTSHKEYKAPASYWQNIAKEHLDGSERSSIRRGKGGSTEESTRHYMAIDTFPRMTSEAMEDFYIEKVEEQRQRRANLFSRLQTEAVGYEDVYVSDASHHMSLTERVMANSTDSQ